MSRFGSSFGCIDPALYCPCGSLMPATQVERSSSSRVRLDLQGRTQALAPVHDKRALCTCTREPLCLCRACGGALLLHGQSRCHPLGLTLYPAFSQGETPILEVIGLGRFPGRPSTKGGCQPGIQEPVQLQSGNTGPEIKSAPRP